MSIEIWKDIKGLEGKYMISSLGRVKGVAKRRDGRTGSILSLEKNRKGYVYFRPKIKGERLKIVSVHKTVASHFMGPRPSIKNQIDHIDGNKENNSIGNLEYVTPSENVQRCLRMRKRKRGAHYMKNANGKKKWRARITINGLGRIVISDHLAKTDALKAYFEIYNEWFGLKPW